MVDALCGWLSLLDLGESELEIDPNVRLGSKLCNSEAGPARSRRLSS